MGTPHLLTPQQLSSHCKLVQFYQKQQLQFKALENLSHFTSRMHSCCSRAQTEHKSTSGNTVLRQSERSHLVLPLSLFAQEQCLLLGCNLHHS